MSRLIACQLHDYIEIACLYGYRVRLTLKDRSVLEGKAVDIWGDAEKREYLLLDAGGTQRVELNTLVRMEVLSANPVFNVVNF